MALAVELLQTPADQARAAPSAPAQRFALCGRAISTDDLQFAQAVAWAHAHHHRPVCLCQGGPDRQDTTQPQPTSTGPRLEMYTARLGDGYIVKRMPETGHLHAQGCPSYEPPAEETGLAPLMGTAICEDPETGRTRLKLDFALSRLPGRSAPAGLAATNDSVRSTGPRLSLGGLLRYLWAQAGLNHWHPSFEGRRPWGVVRHRLLQAARLMEVGGTPLAARVYIPEPFSVEHREQINARRLAHWAAFRATPGQPQKLMLLIGELKELAPARHGHCAVIKHLPDLSFSLEAGLYRRLERRYEAELARWGADPSLRMVVAGTVGIAQTDRPAIETLAMMLVSRQWVASVEPPS